MWPQTFSHLSSWSQNGLCIQVPKLNKTHSFLFLLFEDAPLLRLACWLETKFVGEPSLILSPWPPSPCELPSQPGALLLTSAPSVLGRPLPRAQSCLPSSRLPCGRPVLGIFCPGFFSPRPKQVPKILLPHFHSQILLKLFSICPLRPGDPPFPTVFPPSSQIAVFLSFLRWKPCLPPTSPELVVSLQRPLTCCILEDALNLHPLL